MLAAARLYFKKDKLSTKEFGVESRVNSVVIPSSNPISDDQHSIRHEICIFSSFFDFLRVRNEVSTAIQWKITMDGRKGWIMERPRRLRM